MSLNFQTVPLVESGLGKILILSDICNQLNIKKPLIITDQGLFKLGFVEEIEKSLSIKNISPCVYNRVKADPPGSNIFEAVNLFQNHKFWQIQQLYHLVSLHPLQTYTNYS